LLNNETTREKREKKTRKMILVSRKEILDLTNSAEIRRLELDDTVALTRASFCQGYGLFGLTICGELCQIETATGKVTNRVQTSFDPSLCMNSCQLLVVPIGVFVFGEGVGYKYDFELTYQCKLNQANLFYCPNSHKLKNWPSVAGIRNVQRVGHSTAICLNNKLQLWQKKTLVVEFELPPDFRQDQYALLSDKLAWLEDSVLNIFPIVEETKEA
jgi:hypothetical protein